MPAASPLGDRLELVAQLEEEFARIGPMLGIPGLHPAVRDALVAVPRERFVPPEVVARAYENVPLPIGCGQTISQPFVVALMTQLLALSRSARVLEVGTGCGYQTAVLAELSDRICSIEVEPELAAAARARLGALGYGCVDLRVGDGALGWPEYAPFDAIVVTAAPLHIPAALLEQLAPGGRLVAPVGPRGAQVLVVARKDPRGCIEERDVLPVAFVSLHQR